MSDWLLPLGALVLWFVLTRWVLPRMGCPPEWAAPVRRRRTPPPRGRDRPEAPGSTQGYPHRPHWRRTMTRMMLFGVLACLALGGVSTTRAGRHARGRPAEGARPRPRRRPRTRGGSGDMTNLLKEAPDTKSRSSATGRDRPGREGPPRPRRGGEAMIKKGVTFVACGRDAAEGDPQEDLSGRGRCPRGRRGSPQTAGGRVRLLRAVSEDSGRATRKGGGDERHDDHAEGA